jgi:hypothetical protein
VSVRVMSDVWDLPIPTSQKMILLSMADHANDEGCNAYPSIARLAHRCSLSERAVQYGLRSLESDGYLTMTRPAGQHRPASYQVNPGAQPLHPSAHLGVQHVHPSESPGVQMTTSRGANDDARGAPVAPDPKRTVMNHPPKEVALRQCPSSFTLTPPRFEYGLAQGLTVEAIGEEFEAFLDYRYRTPKTKWDLAWKAWVRKAVQIRGLGMSRTGPLTAAEKTSQAFANVRARLALEAAK